MSEKSAECFIGAAPAVALRPKQSDHIIAEWRENWPVGVASMIGMGLGASILPVIASLFIQPLEEAFGWTRGQIGAANYASLLMALVAPFAGRIIDRDGARTLVTGGFTLIGLTYLALSAMPGSLWVYYGLFAIMNIVAVGTSGLGFSKIISSVFIQSRGFSLAVGRSGLAISAMILPTLLFSVISHFGWRAGYITMAIMVLCLALPACWLWIDPHHQKDGIPDQPAHDRLPWRTLLTDRRVLTLAAGAAFAYTPLVAITTQLQPLLTGGGIQSATAAGLLGVLGVASFIGLLITGLLVDRIWAPVIAVVFMTSAAGGALLMMHIEGDWRIALIAVFLLGFAHGAEVDLSAYMIARYCGLRSFASIYGIVIFAVSVSTAVGSSMIGVVYDRTGAYDKALIVGAAMLFMSAGTYLSLGRYPNSKLWFASTRSGNGSHIADLRRDAQ